MLADSGEVIFTDEADRPLQPSVIKLLKSQQEPALTQMIERKIDEINADYNACLNTHLQTSLLSRWLEKEPPPPPPALPVTAAIGTMDRLLGRATRIKDENDALARRHASELADWAAAKQAAEQQYLERERVQAFADFGDPEAMQDILAHVLSYVAWPRETEVSFAFDKAGAAAFLDVDFPEVEDMPTRVATAAGRGLRVVYKERSKTDVNRDYERMVHAIAFRLLGEVFVALPVLQNVIVSGYTQRVNSATAQVEDVYILSVHAARDSWSANDIARLPQIDPVKAVEAFEIRKRSDRTKALMPIEPIPAL